MIDSCSGGRFELNDVDVIGQRFWVHDYLKSTPNVLKTHATAGHFEFSINPRLDSSFRSCYQSYLQLQGALVDDLLDFVKPYPKVISIENFELCDGFELFNMVWGYLGDFQELDVVLVLNEGTTCQE